MKSSSCRLNPTLRYALALSLLVWLSSAALAQSRFVHTSGTQLIDGTGHPLMLRGTNLGNWLVQEGYMFHFEQGPQSAREIEALTNELLGPEAADKFWHSLPRAVRHARRHSVSEAGGLQFDSHPDPLQILSER